MRAHRSPLSLVAAAACLWPSLGAAHELSGWMILRTADIQPLGEVARQHGAHALFELADLPSADDEAWQDAADPARIDHSERSLFCSADVACRAGVHFTYFQTFLDLDAGAAPSSLRLSFEDIDDGVQVTIFNSAHPDGVALKGSTLRASRGERRQVTRDLSKALRAGEVNRIVVTHVDDCCGWSIVRNTQVLLDNQALTPTLEE